MKKESKTKYDINLTKREKKELEEIYKRKGTKDKVRKRAHCILLYKAGHSLEALRDDLYISMQSVINIIKMFLASGLKGIKKLKYKGDPGNLTTKEKEELKTYLNEKHPSTAKQIVEWVQHEFSKVFTPTGITKLLKRLGYNWKKPKLIPGNAERIRVKLQKKSLASLKPEIPLEVFVFLQSLAGVQFNSKKAFFERLISVAGNKDVMTYRSKVEKYLLVSDSSQKAQEKHLEHYNEIKTFVGKGVKVFHADAMHLVHLPVLGKCWIKRGLEYFIYSNTGRKRLNILGAYDPDSHELLYDLSESNCDHKRILEFLKKIENSVERSIHSIVLVLDNAKYHHHPMIREYLKESRIILMFTPPYCPNLNLIERFWKFCKKHLVVNKYIKKYKDFKDNVYSFFGKVNEYANELKSLITENFQTIGT